MLKGPDGDVLIELRATPAANLGRGIGGSQTMCAPSIHPSGERIEFSPDDGRDALDLLDAVAVVDPVELRRMVRLIAAAALALRAGGEPAATAVLAAGGIH